MGPIHPCSDAQGISRCPLQHQRISDFPEETRAVPQVDTQLERNPELPDTTPRKLRNSTLHTLGRPYTLQRFQRKPTFPLELERVLDTIYETPEVSRDTRPHLRGMLSFPQQVKKSPVLTYSNRDEGRLPFFAWKGVLTSPSHSRGGCYLHDTGGEPGSLVTIRKPLISPSTRDQA